MCDTPLVFNLPVVLLILNPFDKISNSSAGAAAQFKLGYSWLLSGL